MMVVSVPPRSAQQRMSALERANEIRSERARLKCRIKSGEQTAVAVLADPPEWALTMKVWNLLLSQSKWGNVKIAKLFRRLDNMSPSKTVGGLSTRQRVRLIDELAGR